MEAPKERARVGETGVKNITARDIRFSVAPMMDWTSATEIKP
jgi:hypothetical protein